jgi:hypothetical protein
MVELYLHSPICFLGEVLNKFKHRDKFTFYLPDSIAVPGEGSGGFPFDGQVHIMSTISHLPYVLLSLHEIAIVSLRRPMLVGPLVTTAWRALRLRMEETPSSFGG